ncbi:hypothetical protein GGR54DRAFT_71303 [Hypoxylon sp. NC1633]|nr:hypothetical protein GGR54DRAFT_71303 [Hypoxylon sp. NC1633]
MVNTSTIIQSNRQFSSQHQSDEVVGVFAGATSGIGARTLERMTTMYHSPTFYVLGRSSSSQFAAQRKMLESLNPACKIVYIETDVSLISGIDLACQQIAEAESKVDYLCMSMGGLPLSGAKYTREGLEACFTVSYTSRIRLIFNLLPLLNRSARPRVLSVLNGGKETHIAEEDLGLEKNWSILGVVNHTTLLTSLAFDGIAAENSKLTLIHNAPGLVESDNPRRRQPLVGVPFLRRIYIKVIRFIFRIRRYFTGMSPQEAGERQTYHLTSDKYGPGSLRVSKASDIVPSNDALAYYQERGWFSKIWEFTLATWDKALAT